MRPPRRPRTPLRKRVLRLLQTWWLMFAACSAAPTLAHAQYATILPACSWLSPSSWCGANRWEREVAVKRAANALAAPLATGVGFGLIVLGHARFMRWWGKRRDRRAFMTRLGYPPPPFRDRLWRATVGRLVAWGIGERRACDRPPKGWHCTRAPGHEGPCAAHPDR